MPYPFIEGCFKGLYLTFVRYSKFSNAAVAAGQAFMAQCVVEVSMCGIARTGSCRHEEKKGTRI